MILAVGTEAESWRNAAYHLALCILPSLLLKHNPEPPTQGWHRGMDPPTLIINQDNTP